MGIEPTSSAWEAEVLPLNYTRYANRLVRARFSAQAVFLHRPCLDHLPVGICLPRYFKQPEESGNSVEGGKRPVIGARLE